MCACPRVCVCICVFAFVGVFVFFCVCVFVSSACVGVSASRRVCLFVWVPVPTLWRPLLTQATSARSEARACRFPAWQGRGLRDQAGTTHASGPGNALPVVQFQTYEFQLGTIEPHLPNFNNNSKPIRCCLVLLGCALSSLAAKGDPVVDIISVGIYVQPNRICFHLGTLQPMDGKRQSVQTTRSATL